MRAPSFFAALRAHVATKRAVVDASAQFSYSSLLRQTLALRDRLPSGGNVGVFLPPTAALVPALLAVWASGSTAVPLSPLFPAAALSPLLKVIHPAAIVTTHALRHALPPFSTPVELVEDAHPSEREIDYPAVCDQLAPLMPSTALIFFTSGTTGHPKGVVWSQQMLMYQLHTLSEAWKWSSADRILNVLPLHHIHGMVNVVLSAVFNGATLEMHSAFDAHSVWRSILGEGEFQPPTVFMAVPAVYKKLILYYNAASPADQNAMRQAAASLRLYVCGSASLSKSDFDAWKYITGHTILERYGMTETGMTLSNLYDDRHHGLLGCPLPGVQVRVEGEHQTGQLLVKGPGVFQQYYRMPDITERSFTPDGWFKTGDVVSIDQQTGYYKLLGRESSDIIKTGGYKVSALEIEDVIRDCQGVVDCCVLGVPDDVLGQRIAAAIIVDDTKEILSSVRQRVEQYLPKYKIPRQYHVVDDFPRNVLGKVQKQMLRLRLGLAS